MQNTILLLLLLVCQSLLGQEKKEIPKEDFERPFNFFAAAGAAYRFGDLYDVTISPIDNTVQFEDVLPIHTGFSMGLVWNPFPNNSKKNTKKYFEQVLRLKEDGVADRSVKALRRHAAIALLVNVAQLTFSPKDVNTSSPIDVGFGLGYRNDNFLILGTLEFTPMRTPKEYFTNGFRDQNKTLTLAGSQEPVRTISIKDDALFTDKIFISIGLRIAYTFTKPKE